MQIFWTNFCTGYLLLFILTFCTLFTPGVPVCSLETKQNAIYWRIPENKEPGSVVEVLPIEGRVEGEGAEMELRLVGGGDWFQLNPTTKTLTLLKPVDRDTGTTKLMGVVECRSLIPNDNFKVNISVQVSVKDINDNAPIFEKSDYYVNITEELPEGTPIFTQLKATDKDQEGQNSEILYAVVEDGPYSNLLQIPNPWEGTVTVWERIDYEKIKNFTVEIIAKDGGTPSLDSRAQLHVTVVDTDDLNPKFEFDLYNSVIPADTPSGTTLNILPRSILAVDQDTVSSPINYGLSGNNAEKFVINPETGEIIVTGSLSAADSYMLNVKAFQTDKPERQGMTTLHVQVSGQNSVSAPRFTRDLYVVEIEENAPLSSQVIQVSAIDSDKDAVLIYSMREGKEEEFFDVNPSTGVVSLIHRLDHEANHAHTFVVQVTDGVQSGSTTVKVNVIDVNDSPPVFKQTEYTFIPDASSNIVGVVKASDPDPGDQLFYNLLNFNKLFSVDVGGRIRVREGGLTENRTYELVVMAVDSGKPPRQSFAKVKVDLSNTSAPQPHSASVVPKTGGSTILVIALAALCVLLLTVCFVLIIYYCQSKSNRRQKAGNNHQPWPPRPTIIPAGKPSVSSPIGHVNGSLHTDMMNGAMGMYPGNISASHSRIIARYQDTVMAEPVDPSDPRSSESPPNGSFASDESPHGSQSPLHHHDAADRAMTISLSSGGFYPTGIAQTNILETDAMPFIHPHAVPSEPGPKRATLDQRPPLTVYF